MPAKQDWFIITPSESHMRNTLIFLLGMACLAPVVSHANDDDLSPQEMKTLFFGKDDRPIVTGKQIGRAHV